MDETNDLITNFESVFKRQNTRKPLAIYAENDHKMLSRKTNINAKDIISNVTSQIKAMQKAECLKSDKHIIRNKLDKYKKSALLPINMLPIYDELPESKRANINKFDTQCVSDTELISVIEDAEILDVQKGVTQEFDTTFTHVNLDNETSIICDTKRKCRNEQKSINSENVVFVQEGNYYDAMTESNKSILMRDKNNKNVHDSNNRLLRQCKIIDKTKKYGKNDKIDVSDTNCTRILNESMDIEFKTNPSVIIDDTEQPTSPVLNKTKTVRRNSNSHSPLIYNLETFEKFEKLATPIIEENLDFKTTRILINSQIVNKELQVSTNAEPILKKEDSSNPVHEISNNMLIVKVRDKEYSELNSMIKNEKQASISKDKEIESEKCILEDEILFSSDEEDGEYKNIQDLPFTCALETSFYNQSDVLDKTMYVGFQTASNKSIQICTESFNKAKNVFDGVENDLSNKEPTLTKLVELCDSAKPKNIENFKIKAGLHSISTDMDFKTTNNIETERQEMVTDPEGQIGDPKLIEFRKANGKPIPISEQSLLKTKTIFNDIDKEVSNTTETISVNIQQKTKGQINQGFRTASNKGIKLSEKAMARCRKVFQDIDLNDFGLDNESHRSSPDKKGKNYNKESVNAACRDGKSNTVVENISSEINKDLKENNLTKYSKQEKIDDDILKEFDTIEMDSKYTNFVGFKTANNKRIKVSEDALMKTKKVFLDIDFNELEVGKEKNDILKATNKSINSRIEDVIESKFVGFKTASNKEIKISEMALLRTKSILENIDFNDFNTKVCMSMPDKDNINNIKQYDQPSLITSSFTGFKTANNKETRISEQALAKAKNIFGDIEKDANENNEISNSVFQGFKTANNKIVNISKKALDHCKKVFQDLDINEGNVDPTSQKDCNLNSTLDFHGFKTASNKNIKISEKALVKSKKLLQDFEGESLGGDELQSPSENEKKAIFRGFQTANKKPVEISAQALGRSKQFLQDFIEKKVEHKIDNTQKIKENFQTVNNKLISISKENLAKSEKIHENINDYKENIQNKNENITFQGFKTASNKRVNISKEAIAKSKLIFQDINVDIHKDSDAKNFYEDEGESNKTRNSFNNVIGFDKIGQTNEPLQAFGFKTANNHNIKVSEEALMKSRKILGNLEDSIQGTFKDGSKAKQASKIESNTDNDINISNIINTQVLNHFEESLYTEDFCKEITPACKRSGSPILSCPRAKKRKVFETPYRTDGKIGGETDTLNCVLKPDKVISFDNNYKKTKEYTLKDLEVKEKDFKCKPKLDSYIFQFTYNNLLKFEFCNTRHDITKDIITIDNLKKYFLDSVNKKLVPEGWIDNHLKLIIWKLLSYEIKFPNIMRGVCRVKNVLEQLKYRYDKELYNVERPVLRKILEKDDTSVKTMVLCVVDIYVDGVRVNSVKNPTSNVELLLTDGWYCVKSCGDKMLTKLVCDERIVVGTKIVTQGAELLNCEQGIAPWEDTSSVRLKISGNSTRRARWDARLGCHSIGAILTPLSSIRPEGGRVSKLRVFVTRVYPALYVEKFDDGSTVTRSERLEHLHQMKYEAERQVLLEKLYEEVEKEFAEQESQDSEDMYTGNKRRCLDSGSQIAKLMKRSRDPAECKANLTDSQNKLLEDYNNRQREKLLQDVQTRMQEKMKKSGLAVSRNVVTLLKFRIAGVEEKNGGVEVTRGMLSIWKPNDAVIEMITEGVWIELLNVIPTAYRYSELQISAGRQSVFNKSKYKENDKIKSQLTLLKRKCYLIRDLVKNPTFNTEYNEIDTVGLIFQIDPTTDQFNPTEQPFQNVYLTDADKNLICVNFWGGLRKFGFENTLETGQIVTCVNLQKRAGNTGRNVLQYRATEFSYFTKTPKSDSARAAMEDLVEMFRSLDKRKFCEDCVALKNNYNLLKIQGNIENVSPYRFHNNDYNNSKNKIFIDSPLTRKVDDNFNLTGLDFESSFKQTDPQELSPKALLRKRQVNQKIARLKMYGEPPPLSRIYIINKSKNAANSYKSPLVTKTEVTNSEKMLQDESPKTTIGKDGHTQSSPIIMNRTYIKRTNVNPVKLNFSNNVAIEENDSVVDDFPGEFDSSPPLSLDNVSLSN